MKPVVRVSEIPVHIVYENICIRIDTVLEEIFLKRFVRAEVPFRYAMGWQQ